MNILKYIPVSLWWLKRTVFQTLSLSKAFMSYRMGSNFSLVQRCTQLTNLLVFILIWVFFLPQNYIKYKFWQSHKKICFHYKSMWIQILINYNTHFHDKIQIFTWKIQIVFSKGGHLCWEIQDGCIANLSQFIVYF